MVLCTTYMAFVYMNTHDITSTIAHVGISCWYKQFVPLFNRHRQVSVTSQSQHQHPATIYCYVTPTNTCDHALFVYTTNQAFWLIEWSFRDLMAFLLPTHGCIGCSCTRTTRIFGHKLLGTQVLGTQRHNFSSRVLSPMG